MWGSSPDDVARIPDHCRATFEFRYFERRMVGHRAVILRPFRHVMGAEGRVRRIDPLGSFDFRNGVGTQILTVSISRKTSKSMVARSVPRELDRQGKANIPEADDGAGLANPIAADLYNLQSGDITFLIARH